MKYIVGIKSYSDFQKMLNQWVAQGIEFKLLKVEFDMSTYEVHYMLKKQKENR